MAVPAGTAPPPDRGHHQPWRQACSEVAPRQHQRLSHPRSRLDGRAGTGLHALRRAHLCGGGGQGGGGNGSPPPPRPPFFFPSQKKTRGAGGPPLNPPPPQSERTHPRTHPPLITTLA